MIERDLMTSKEATTVRPGPEAGTQAVVFDLGGVLLDWNPRHLYHRLFGSDIAGMERFLFLQWFDDIVVSGREGVIKPDPAIFRLLLSRFCLAASGCVFIDGPKNLEAATQLGFHAIHFCNASRLRADLSSLGLLPGQTARASP